MKNNTAAAFDLQDFAAHAEQAAGNLTPLSPYVGEGSILITGAELATMKHQERQYVVDGLIQQTGLFALVGGSDSGKSTIFRQMAIAVTTGTPFLSRRTKKGKVLLVTTEDDPEGVLYSYRKQVQDHTPTDLTDLHFLFAPEDPLAEVAALTQKHRYSLIILDAWGDVLRADPKDNGRVRAALNDWHTLAVRHSLAIGILHHTGKRTEKAAPDKSAIIGAQSFEAKMRLVLELRQDVEAEHYRYLSILKGNYLSGKDKSEAIQLRFGDDFIFYPTGETKPKELLAVSEGQDPMKDKYSRAIELQGKGLTMDQIAVELGYTNRSSVATLIAKYRNTAQ